MGEKIGGGPGPEALGGGYLLTEVDHFNRLRLSDGSHHPATREGVLVNLLTAAKEGAMPDAVSLTYQKRRGCEYYWLDQTGQQVAESGYAFHQAPAALARVPFEVAEAIDVNKNLRPGYTKVFLSPKMTQKDAPYAVAKREHLADDDMIRIHALDQDEAGNVLGKTMESVLVADVPLDAWTSMLHDPHNIFGKAIPVVRNGSALPIMAAHRELELPTTSLTEGVVSVIAAVLPYIADPIIRRKVAGHVDRMRQGQESMHAEATSIAARWVDFEMELADSLHTQRATLEIQRYIYQHQGDWDAQELQLIAMHSLDDGGLFMTRELASQVERMKRNSLWTRAGVAAGNEKVMAQLSAYTIRRIQHEESLIQRMVQENVSHNRIAAFEAETNRDIAQSEVKVGGGCAGDASRQNNTTSKTPKNQKKNDTADEKKEKNSNKKNWKTKQARCRIKACPTRPNTVKVGPCDVCMDRCQKMFDKGKDPTKREGISILPVNKESVPKAENAKVDRWGTSPKKSSLNQGSFKREKGVQAVPVVDQYAGSLALAGAKP